MLTAASSGIGTSIVFQLLLIFLYLLRLGILAGGIYLFVLLVKALRKYLGYSYVRKEDAVLRQTLGEALKAHRTSCNMTQEFVADQLGVSRQAVSKWENGTSDPSTSNLLALAKLYGIDAAELLRSIQQ